MKKLIILFLLILNSCTNMNLNHKVELSYQQELIKNNVELIDIIDKLIQRNIIALKIIENKGLLKELESRELYINEINNNLENTFEQLKLLRIMLVQSNEIYWEISTTDHFNLKNK